MKWSVLIGFVGVMMLLPRIGDAGERSDSAGTGGRGASLLIGPIIGAPSGVALMGGVVAVPFSLKVSGGYWGSDWNGIQADIGWVFDTEELLTQGLFLVGGTYRVNPRLLNDQGSTTKTIRQNRYVGLAYEADYAGFFLQAGLAKGRGDYPNPAVLLQAGYLMTLP